jgi:hypothetical protein
MSRMISLWRLALALSLVLTATVAVRAEDKKTEKKEEKKEDAEEKVALDKVPKAILDTVKAKFPDAKLIGASKELDEKKKTVYEIELTVKDVRIDVTLTSEGKIVTVEKVIPAKDLPKVVAEAVEKKYPKATLKTVEEITDGSDKITKYEAIILTTDKKKLEVCFDPTGKFLTEEEKKEEKKKDK